MELIEEVQGVGTLALRGRNTGVGLQNMFTQYGHVICVREIVRITAKKSTLSNSAAE
jgi:hypothetical protein